MLTPLDQVRMEAGDTSPSSFAKIARVAPDPKDDPIGYAEAVESNRRWHSAMLWQALVFYAAVWALLGFAGAYKISSWVFVFVEHTRSGLNSGSPWYIGAFLFAVLAGGMIGYRCAGFRLTGAFEIGAALGVAFFGFTDATSTEAAVFGFLAAIVGTADGFARLFRRELSSRG